jgi:dCMP deaminase
VDGCYRCNNREQKFAPSTAYDVCICVHAEQNALLSAGRFGSPTSGTVMYTTMRPCFGCLKELLQAKIKAIYFIHYWEYPDHAIRGEYAKIAPRVPRFKRHIMSDPNEDWAMGREDEAIAEFANGQVGDSQESPSR